MFPVAVHPNDAIWLGHLYIRSSLREWAELRGLLWNCEDIKGWPQLHDDIYRVYGELQSSRQITAGWERRFR